MTPWSAEEMLDGQRTRVDIALPMPELLTGAPAEKAGRGALLNHPSCPPSDPISKETELN